MNLAKERQGFSLVEVLIAMVVLSVAMMGMATLQVRCMRSNDLANRTTQATNLAQNMLEELIFRQQAMGEFFAAGVTMDPENPVSVPADDSGAIFTRRWEFIDDVPVPAARTIIVTVTWDDPMGAHTMTVEGVTTSASH